ncbi:MAG: uracil phosphoribosyltransferase [Bacteroidia bacterium]|nr:uracil phosphoribosyltransferase [Bacteroidia bacterium]MDW8157920.1 uracil phosphoribosyltransferase [Bacteroidia bacterium]
MPGISEPIVLGASHSIFNQYLAEMRDESVQTDRLRFRFNMQRASEIIAYEMSKALEYETRTIITPLGSLEMPVLAERPVIAVVLRAALVMHDGFLRVFEGADNAFISAFRQHNPFAESQFDIKIEYISTPELQDRTLFLLDPMIATGKTIVLSYQALIRAGIPRKLFIGGIIASEEGIEYVQRHLPQAQIYVGAIDNELTAKGYIVPGLGDAGDLAFGAKN